MAITHIGTMQKTQYQYLTFVVAIALFTGNSLADSVLKTGDVLTICGDSITAQTVYSVYIEDYILMCQPVTGVRVMQCGWGGETSTHFAKHMKDDILTLSPTVVTTSYGMNDGNYDAINPTNEASYRDGLIRIVEAFKSANTRVVIVGSPSAVDTFYFKNPRFPKVSANDYNQTLGHLGEIGKEVAVAQGVSFADVYISLTNAMAKAKSKLGANYPVTGNIDGVHPGPPGHLVMAYAYLKAMGFDGNIGTITYDAASGQATATEGQRVISSNAHEIVIESSRYPFCFFRGTEDAEKSDGTTVLDNWPYGDAAMLQFLPFNEDLNRYVLIVKNLKSPRAKITWGEQSKEFSAGELDSGINLAAEFPQNPFVKPFMEVNQIVQNKQTFETTFIRQYLSETEQNLLNCIPSKTKAIKAIDANYRDIHNAMLENCAKAVKPVTHTIRIEELNS
jgi:lysophospholipase L1-like esterase